MQVVSRDGDHFEVRLTMDPNWMQTHGFNLNPASAHGTNGTNHSFPSPSLFATSSSQTIWLILFFF